MKRAIFFGVFICFLISALNAQIDLKGTVINQADFPVDSLEVTLKGLGHSDMTDVEGKFQIAVTGITTQNQKRLPAPRFRGSHFIVPVTTSNQNVSVQVFNLKGAKLSTVTKVLSEGEHSLPLLKNNRVASSSVLIAIVKRGSDLAKFQIIKTGANGYLLREFAGGVSDYSQTLAKSSPLPALDSLQFIRSITVEGEAKVFIEFTHPIEKWVDEFEVTLDIIPYEAMEWGMTQEGRSHGTVGQELGTSPNGTYPYEFETYYNGAWCSEFHCYIMRIAGCPLGSDEMSGGYPKWMKLGWNILISWYEDNAEYVEQNDIVSQNFVPNPGDFIQLNEHTATVRYIADDDDVVCLDGNYGDKVVLIRRGNYKNFSGLNGYGRRSGIIEESCVSISGK